MGRNYSAMVLGGLATQLLTFLVSVSIARILQPTNYGLFVFGFNFAQWFTIFIDLGLDSVLTIEVAADHSKADDYMTAVALIRILPLLGGLAALAVTVQLVLADPTARLVTFLLGTSILVGTFLQLFGAVFRAFERMEYLALLGVLTQVLTTAGVLALLFLGFGLLPISFVYLAAILAYAAVAVAICRRKFAWFSHRLNWKVVSHILRMTGPFAADDVVSAFMSSAGTVLLTILVSPAATGIFNTAFALIVAFQMHMTVYSSTALPAVSRFRKEASEKVGVTLRKGQKLFFILGAPLALGGFYYRQSLLTLIYGPGYAASGLVFGILVWALAVWTATAGVGMTLAATGRQWVNMVMGILGVGINLVLCFALIPTWGPPGAAVAFLASTTFVAVGSSVAVHRLVSPVDLPGTVVRPVVAAAMMFLFLVAVAPSFFVGLVTGVLLYFALLYLLRGINREDLDLLKQVTRGALFQ